MRDSISAFQAPWWARNRHLQTILPTLLRKRLKLALQWEELSLPDGDFVDLAWHQQHHQLKDTAPLVVIFHGLEGCIESPYAKGVMQSLSEQGYRVVLMHFRGCSGRLNRQWRGYHSGEIGDASYCLEQLKQRYPDAPLFALGYSLGGNMLVNYLARAERVLVDGAAVVSPPLQLDACSEAMQNGFSRFYQAYLMRRMKRNLQAKLAHHQHPSLAAQQIRRWRAFDEFDQHYTAPAHGYAGAKDYYLRCSGKQFLKQVRTPTLLIHAADDPFMDQRVIPSPEELSPQIEYALSATGGHVGFVHGKPWRPKLWLEQAIPQWFDQQLEQLS